MNNRSKLPRNQLFRNLFFNLKFTMSRLHSFQKFSFIFIFVPGPRLLVPGQSYQLTGATNIIPIYLHLRAEKLPCTPPSPPCPPSTSATSASPTRSLSSFPLSLRRLLSIYREFLATDHSPLGTLLFLLITNLQRF